MERTRLATLGVAITAWACALTASAQGGYDQTYPMPREEDWMTSALAPLVTLLGLGILVAVVAMWWAAVLGTLAMLLPGALALRTGATAARVAPDARAPRPSPLGATRSL